MLAAAVATGLAAAVDVDGGGAVAVVAVATVVVACRFLRCSCIWQYCISGAKGPWASIVVFNAHRQLLSAV